MSHRRLRNETLIWVVLLLLQQFQLILMMNVLDMKHGDEAALPNDPFDKPNSHYHRAKRQSSHVTNIDEVIKVIEETAHLYRQNDKQWHEKTKLIECTAIAERQTRKSWSENGGLVLALYLSTSAVAYCLKHCNRLMRDQAEELVRIVGSEEAIEYIRFTNEMLEGEDESEEDDDDALDDDDSAIDPDSRESNTLNEVSYIIAQNIHTTETLADVFLSLNSSSLRSFDGMDDLIEGSINEFMVMSSMLEINTQSRLKRNTPEDRQGKYRSLEEAQRNAMETYKEIHVMVTFKQFNKEIKKALDRNHFAHAVVNLKPKKKAKTEESLSINRQQKLQSLKFPTSLHSAKHRLTERDSQNSQVSYRKRRQIIDDESLDIFFIKNEKYACRLLTFQNEKLSFTKFDELSITSQLWIMSNGIIRHYQTGFYMTVSAEGTIGFGDTLESSFTFEFKNNQLFTKNDCRVTTTGHKGDIVLQNNCDEKDRYAEEWTAVSLGHARDNIALITCLFFIQKTDSCKVLTYTGNSLTLNVLNEHDVGNQLWYWDYNYIRHGQTHKYLTSSWVDSRVRLGSLDEDINQRWQLNDHNLYAIDLPEENVLVIKSSDILVGFKYDYDKQDYNLILANLEGDKVSTCEYNSEYFAVKNEDFPCSVLCVKQEEAKSHFTVKLLVVFLALALGIPSGLFFLICFTGKEAVIAGLLVGIILAAVAGLVVQFSKFFRIQYYSVHFDIFDDEDPNNCLWYQFSGGIKNVKLEQYISIERVGANDFQTVRMTENLDEGWFLYEKSIKQTGQTCGLSVMESADRSTDVEDIHFECTNEAKRSEKWIMVKASESSEFREQTTCMYFLRQKGIEKDCSVLTVNASSNDIGVQTEMPIPSRLFDQLWFRRGQSYFSLRYGDSFNISASEVDTFMEKIPLTDEQAENGFSSGCARSLYFIKSESNTCKLLTYKNVSGENIVTFEEYDNNNFFTQLWDIRDGPAKNFVSNVVFYLNISESSLVAFSEDFTAYADKVLCPFFLQQDEPPCGVLSADKTDESIFFGPVTSDLAEGQLWYKSSDFLVHLKSGKSLVLKDDGKFELSLRTDVPFSAGYNYREVGNNTVFIQANISFSIQKWRKIYSVDAFQDFSLFQCTTYNRTYFFIKEKNNPCVILTAGENNETPYFEVFDDNRVQAQLWYLENSRLINLYSGLVLKLHEPTSKYIMAEHLYYDPFQDIEVLDELGNFTALGNQNFGCKVKTVVSNGFTNVVCSKTSGDGAVWEFVGYGILEDISKIKCLFYIRSATKPCEFLTGYNEGNSLKIRPLTEKLIQSQLFYTKGDLIIHQQTGLLLSSANNSITLRSESTEFDQTWIFENNHLKVHDRNKMALTFDVIDGTAQLGYLEIEKFGFSWSKVPLDFDFEKGESRNPGCSENIDLDNVSLFFITSTIEKCVVLTAGRLGEEPMFIPYDKNNLESQLWYFYDNHIINAGTEMALMVEYDDLADDHDIIMWDKYTFSTKQKFITNNYSQFKYWQDDNCHLISLKTETGVTISLTCQKSKDSDLTTVKFDDEGNFIDEISCLFFIRTTKAPCELLTVVDNSIKMRPLSENFVEGQLWYWKNMQLVNSKSSQILTIMNYWGILTLSLQNDRTVNRAFGDEWYFNKGYIKSIKRSDSGLLVVGFETDSDLVKLQSLSYGERYSQQWIFVDKNEGLNLAAKNRFHCEQNQNLPMYVVRSEHDECPLLNVIGGDKVGYKEVDDSGRQMDDTLWWTRQGDHICNAKHSLCLSLSTLHPQSAQLEPRYAFKRSQKWTIQNEIIKYLYGDERLTYTGSQLILSPHHHGSNKQTWKWFSSTQIEDDPKYLRCSRCYDKSEETAAEVISYIPIISLFYNIGRSIAYAIKRCPKVALGALRDSLIDLAMDAIMVLSAGSASAFALGVKTAIKFGLKAGLKAFANGIKSMIKVAIKSFKKGIVNFVKTGFRRTLKQQLTKMKLNIKSIISTFKKIPATLKSISKTTVGNFQKFVKTSLRSMKTVAVKTKSQWKTQLKGVGLRLKASLKHMPRQIKTKFSKFGVKLKRQLKSLNDKLAKKAENAVKKADDMKFRGKIRCKRGGEYCGVSMGITLKEKIHKMNNYLFNGQRIEDVPTNLQKDMKKLHELAGVTKHQKAAVGLKKKDGFSFTDHAEISDEGLLDSAGNLVSRADKRKHTEPFLMDNLEAHVKNCDSKSPCEVFMFSRLSPCHSRKDSIEDCLSVIKRKCMEWLRLYSTECFVSFEKFYDDTLPFAEWSDTLTIAIKDGDFPIKFGKDSIDEILSDPKSMDTISSIIQKEFDDILLDDNLHKRLTEIWSGKVETSFQSFYTDLSNHVNQNIRKKLDDLRNSPAIKNAISRHDELDKFYKSLTDNFNDDTLISNSLKTFKEASSNELKREAGKLYTKVTQTVREQIDRKEKLVHKLAVQVRDRLDAVSKKAEVTDILGKASAESNNAVRFYRFRPDDDIYTPPRGNAAG